MKSQSRWVVVFVFAFSLLVCHQVRAASITGKVVDVSAGDEITVINLNRQVRIKLLAIDAPEMNQPFGAAAKQHLFDLVYDKLVSVEYQGIGQHNILIGRVLSGGNDICAQMVRDGAAWFDLANKNLLTEEQREIYFQSEQAARSEKRGLWQSGDAVAPWEFVKAEELKRSTTPTSTRSVAKNGLPTQVRPVAELDSMGLLQTGGTPPALLGTWADPAVLRTWERYQPVGQNFSMMAPDGGHQEDFEINFGGQTMPVSFYVVREGDNVYEIFWMKRKSLGDSDSSALGESLDGYMDGFKNHLAKSGLNGTCDATTVRNVSGRGYSGQEYDLSSCAMPNIVRIYTKTVRGERHVFGGLVIFRQKNDNVSRFLKSFTEGVQKSEGPKVKATK